MIKSTRSFGFWYDGIALVRIASGVMLMLHGWEIFEGQGREIFTELLFDMSLPFPEAMTYTARMIELAGGFFLILGLFTRVMTALMFVAFMVITFALGEGKPFADDQLSFLRGLLCLTFFFTGAGRISLDFLLFMKRYGDDHDNPSSKGFGRYVSRS